jgi:hypothetical protein
VGAGERSRTHANEMNAANESERDLALGEMGGFATLEANFFDGNRHEIDKNDFRDDRHPRQD